MSEPALFISHKHSDRAIAEIVANFMKNSTAGKVRVHLSSSPDFEGPRFGRPVNDELKRALAETELVVLIYTTATEDWSYCMWECGLAVDPRDEKPTSVVVIQCGRDEPKPFGSDLRVDAQNLDSIQGFTKELLTTKDFFPARDGPLTGFAAEGNDVKEIAADLHSKLSEVLPSEGPGESTPAAPYLRVLLDSQAAARVREAYLSKDVEESTKIIETEAVISESYGARALLGMALGPESKLGDVLRSWQEGADEDEEPRWFYSLTDQIQSALAGKIRPLKWAPIRIEQGRADVPFVAASRVVGAGIEFDVYLAPISPRPILVRERMIAVADMYHKNANETSMDEMTLVSVVDEMKERGAKRLPILDGEAPKTIVHKSTIDEFVAGRALAGDSVEDLTLRDLLDHYAGVVDKWYVELEPDQTMEDAVDTVNANLEAEDAFVIQEGEVVGWLTNVILLES